MKVVQPSSNVMTRPGLDEHDILQFIEQVGRTCYKSEDKITDGSAEKFVAGILSRGHEAVIEHASLIYKVTEKAFREIQHAVNRHESLDGVNLFLRFTENNGRYIISGNIRAWRQFIDCSYDHAGIISKVAQIVADYPALFPEFCFSQALVDISRTHLRPITVDDLVGRIEHLVHHDVTVRFICDRGVSHEIVRHRAASYCQESTRYCNYSSGKFGGELTFINPVWLDHTVAGYALWRHILKQIETQYLYFVSIGFSPQEARSILPNSLKTEVVMTANLGEWLHFFTLCRSPAAHPDMRFSADLAYTNMTQDATIAKILVEG